MNIKMPKYKIGFARTALLFEIGLVARLYVELRSWDLVKQEVLKNNSLQARTQRSNEIALSEIQKRFSLLTVDQIELVADADHRDVRQIVWISLCKQYLFIGDFSLEVLSQLCLNHSLSVSYDDYYYFFNAKAEWHPELEAVSEKTRSNARQALFQMLRQCELITENNQLIPQLLSSAVQNCSTAEDLAFIPGAVRL